MRDSEKVIRDLSHVLHEAIAYGKVGLMKTILSAEGVDVNLAFNGKTPLIRAVECFDRYSEQRLAFFAIIKLLCEEPRIDINAVDSHNLSALNWAVRRSEKLIVEYFLSREDIDVNHQDKFGLSPLHNIVDYYFLYGDEDDQKLDIMKMLLEHPRVDYKIKDNDGLSVLDKAKVKGDKVIIKLIEERIAKDDSKAKVSSETESLKAEIVRLQAALVAERAKTKSLEVELAAVKAELKRREPVKEGFVGREADRRAAAKEGAEYVSMGSS